jgi:DNA repair photolyase
VGVFVSPIIPGLNDHEIPAILAECQRAGAQAASWQLLRLPLNVEPVFRQWLRDNVPQLTDRVEARIRECRGGRWNDSQFHSRMRGEGAYADHLRTTFRQFAARWDLHRPLPPLDSTHFRPPRADVEQRLFEFGEDPL